MDRLSAMSAFVTAVELRSLSAAARRLGQSPASVSRGVAALEERLGTPLLHRTTRRLRLTEAGEAYLATCRRVLEELDAAERGVAAQHSVPSGLLTVTAPAVFGRRAVRPVLDRFLEAHAEVTARLLLIERFVNLVDEGVDLAVRVGHLPDSSLVATRIGALRRVICASPDYIRAHGAPRTPAELADHVCIGTSDLHGTAAWSFAPTPAPVPSGRARPLRPVMVHPRLTVNEAIPALDSVLEGRGIARALSYQVTPELEAGRLVLLLVAYEPEPLPVHLLFPRSHGATAKLRRFVEFATPLLRAELDAATRIADAA